MKKYFVHEVKKNAYVLGALVLVMIILYVTPLLISSPEELEHDTLHIGTLSAYAGILAVCVPVWLTQYKMKKRSIDLYYALPLTHTKILAVRYLLGLIAVFAPYTVAYWLGAFVVMAKINYAIYAVWYLPLYFSALIPIYIIYSISAFVYTRANRDIDGFMFLIFWFFALALVVFAFELLTRADNFYAQYFIPFEPLDVATDYFQGRIYYPEYEIYWSAGKKVCMALGFCITALLSAGATFGLFYTEKFAKAENAGQLSESWFGYKVMLPLYTVCLTSLCEADFYFSVFIFLLIATGMFFANVLYKRTIKIGKKQALIFALSLFAGIILSIINTVA